MQTWTSIALSDTHHTLLLTHAYHYELKPLRNADASNPRAMANSSTDMPSQIRNKATVGAQSADSTYEISKNLIAGQSELITFHVMAKLSAVFHPGDGILETIQKHGGYTQFIEQLLLRNKIDYNTIKEIFEQSADEHQSWHRRKRHKSEHRSSERIRPSQRGRSEQRRCEHRVSPREPERERQETATQPQDGAYNTTVAQPNDSYTVLSRVLQPGSTTARQTDNGARDQTVPLTAPEQMTPMTDHDDNDNDTHSQTVPTMTTMTTSTSAAAMSVDTATTISTRVEQTIQPPPSDAPTDEHERSPPTPPPREHPSRDLNVLKAALKDMVEYGLPELLIALRACTLIANIKALSQVGMVRIPTEANTICHLIFSDAGTTLARGARLAWLWNHRGTSVYSDLGNDRMTVLLKALREYIDDVSLRQQYDEVMIERSLEYNNGKAPDLLEAALALLRGPEALQIETDNSAVNIARELLQLQEFNDLPVIKAGVHQRLKLIEKIGTYVSIALLRELDMKRPVNVMDAVSAPREYTTTSGANR